MKEDKTMNCCSDVMTPIEASSCCTPHDTVAQAAQAMRDSGCGCAPVVEDTGHLKLIGVAADDRRASDVRVETIMRPLAACCGASEPVEEARRKLHEHRATSLPVVNKAGGCCGTISVHGLEKS
jgi:CBS domain-containing protein